MTAMQRQGLRESAPKRRRDSPQTSPKPAKLSRSAAEGEDERPGKEAEGENLCCTSESNNMTQNSRIQRYLIAVEYIGTRFSGSQQQPNCRTVVGVLQEAFLKFVGIPVSIFCSSRTDAGVHALSNVCHVDVERLSKRKPGEVLPPHEPGVVKRALNHFLGKNEGDISVVDVRCVPDDFHSRFKAQERTYFYRLLCGPEPLSVLDKERAWYVPEDLDILAMQKASEVLVGSHDFSSFRAAGCQANSPIKTLDELHVCEVSPSMYFPSIEEREHMMSLKDSPSSLPELRPRSADFALNSCHQQFGSRKRHRCYIITARARSFLYHQVRLLVGVLKSVGTGQLTIADVKRILDAKTVTAAPPMAPACGLYLGNVNCFLEVTHLWGAPSQALLTTKFFQTQIPSRGPGHHLTKCHLDLTSG